MIPAIPASGRSRDGRVRGRGLLEAVTLALGQPSAWPIALAGFLARGGIVLFLLPVVVLPTPTGLATAFGSDIIAIAIAAPTPSVVRLALTALGLVAGWLVVGSVVGAFADVHLARWGAAGGRHGSGPDDGPSAVDRRAPAELSTSRAGRRDGPLVARVALVRLGCHLPLLLVSAWAAVRIVSAVYREYISPGDLSVPLPLRVAASVPDAIVLLIVAWLLGEALGGLAARGVVLQGRPPVRAILGAITSFVLHPLSAGFALVATTIVLVALVLPPLAGATLVWNGLETMLVGGGSLPAALPASLGFAALWLAGLGAAAIATTLRHSIWTWHALRVRGAAPIALRAAARAAESSTAEA